MQFEKVKAEAPAQHYNGADFRMPLKYRKIKIKMAGKAMKF
jgi:hypothetical protein